MMRTKESHELGDYFFDFRDDEGVLVQEDDVTHTLVQLSRPFSDDVFPAAPASLYRTPQQPPPGTMPPMLAAWARLSRLDVRHCHSPVTFPGGTDRRLSAVVQGALGDAWLVSALNILRHSPDILKQVVVSDRHRDKGIYTMKLFEEGAWRYLHVDDRIPCWPSRTFYFCSCKDRNQVWAPLIEKAFAKLHGCYENLGRGAIEQGLRCLTGTPVIRTPLSREEPLSIGAESVAGGSGRDLDALWSRLTTGSRLRTGLIVGRAYGVLSARRVTAPATPSRDAVSFRLLELACPGDTGQWRGDWSNDSGLWAAYPSVDAELRRGASDEGDADGLVPGQSTQVAGGVESFWISLDDFAVEFSQKSYRGLWVPGDALTGSGGCSSSPSFLQNPFYPAMVQRNATTVTVCLSVVDRRWATDPVQGGPAIGYYVVRLTGSKPRLTRFKPSKVVARSASLVVASQVAGEHTLDAGRYAVVPVTAKPLQRAEPFLLDLAADKSVEWEQAGDEVEPLDYELNLSDDEDGAAAQSSAATNDLIRSNGSTGALEALIVECEDLSGPPGDQVATAIHEQIAQLSSFVEELGQDLRNSGTSLCGQSTELDERLLPAVSVERSSLS